MDSRAKVAKWLEQYRARVMPRDMHPYQYGQHADELFALIQPGEPVAEVVLNANLEPTLAILHDAVLPVGARLYLAPQPERDWEAMARDHEAMEKLRTLPGSWVVFVDGPVFGRIASLKRTSRKSFSKIKHGKLYDDPTDAILGGEDE